jgi:hypothetical protein
MFIQLLDRTGPLVLNLSGTPSPIWGVNWSQCQYEPINVQSSNFFKKSSVCASEQVKKHVISQAFD